MADYEKLYHLLFNKLTDLHDEIEKIQQLAEELYITSSEESKPPVEPVV